MTPRQARVALATFTLLATGVAYNALYMQGDAAPARRVASDTSPNTTARIATGAAGVTQASLRTASTAAREPGPETIRAIQRELNQRGYGPVASDGIVRPVTRAAIMSFEQDNRLPITGEATEALLARLVLGASANERSTVTSIGQVQSANAEETIKHVQRMLAANGYRPGPPDGRLGTATVEAIRAFEQDQGLQPKGRVSAEVVSRLQASTSKLRAAEAR